MVEKPEELTFSVPTTVDDYQAFFVFVGRTPRSLLLQAVVFLGLAFWIVVVVLAIGAMTAVFEPGRLAGLQRYAAVGWRDDLAPLWPWLIGGTLGLYVLNILVLYPRQARLLAVRLMDAYPESRESGPSRAMTTRLHVTPERIIGETRDQRVSVAWSLVRRLVETRRHVFIMTSRSTAVVVPKQSLDAAGVEQLIAFASDRVATPEAAT